jgi:DNA-binding CsgD family transcriptional regulator
MRKYALVLYENEKDKAFLLEKTQRLAWLSCTVGRLGDSVKIDREQLVIGREDSLPSLLKLKALVQTVFGLPLLVLVPQQNLPIFKMLESNGCSLVSEKEDDEGLSSMVLKTMRSRRDDFCAETPQCMLTERESQVVALIISGQDNRQIADKLGIKLSTVSAHKKNLFLKTGVHTTSQLVVWAMVRDMGFS